MANSIASRNGHGHSTAVDGNRADRDARSTAVDRLLKCLTEAMEETGWTVDALAAHWKVHRSYVYRILDASDPLRADRICALPDDLEAVYEAKRAKSFGYVVVKPLTGDAGRDAIIAGVAGVLGMISQMSAPQLPDKASGMAKAAIGENQQKKTA